MLTRQRTTTTAEIHVDLPVAAAAKKRLKRTFLFPGYDLGALHTRVAPSSPSLPVIRLASDMQSHEENRTEAEGAYRHQRRNRVFQGENL